MTKKYKLKKGRAFGLLIIILLIIGFAFRADIAAFGKSSYNSITGAFTGMKEKSVEKTMPSIAATVNSKNILQEDLDARYSKLPEQYKLLMTKEDLLEQMINEKIILEKAKDIQVNTDEIDQMYSEALTNSKMTEAELKKSLADEGSSKEELLNSYKEQLIIKKYLDKNLFADLEISPNDVKKYYDSNIASFSAKEGQVRAKHILVKTEKEALEIKEKLLKGEDFAKLAKEFSIGPSAVSGGDLGFVSKGELVAEFEDALFKLSQNEVSDPVETQFGWHIIKRDKDMITFDEAKESLEQQLLAQKQQALIDTYVTQLKSSADVSYGGSINQEPVEPIEEKKLSECLKDSVLYTTNSCKYCIEQSKELGKDYESVLVVDCSKATCEGVKGYPTWEIDNDKYPGFKTKEELKALLNC